MQTTVGLGIYDAYQKLRLQLTRSACGIASEDPPKCVVATYGSLWGMSPKTAKKTMQFEFLPENSGTRINAISALSSDYVRFTLVGCAFALAIMLLSAWISIDLSSGASVQGGTVWSWIVTFDGHFSAPGALFFSDLTGVLAFFLLSVLALEVCVVVYIHRNVGSFAKEILKTLQ